MSVQQRSDEIKRIKLCPNCLRDHSGQECRSSGCRQCNGDHNTLLHVETEPQAMMCVIDGRASNDDMMLLPYNHNHAESNVTNVTVETPIALLESAYNQRSCVILATAIVLIKDRFGKYRECRALLDSGAQSNLMTKKLKEQLQLRGKAIEMSILGVGGQTSGIVGSTNTIIKSRVNGYQAAMMFYVMDKIAEQIPATKLDISKLNVPKGFPLADPHYDHPCSIDILIGAAVFWELLCAGQFKLAKDQPIMQKTQLGWIISGEMHGGTSSTACFVASNDALQRQLETFWKIEEGVDNHMYSLEEQACEDNFTKNTTYGNDGRYSVHLPFKREPKDLGDSYTGALRRLQAMENKFAKNKLLKDQYVAFMREYETLGHMAQIKDHENSFGDVHYLPHHAVYKQSSTTIKLRVVFDASCKTSTGLSLNDILMVVPTIQQDLFAILIRFRQYPYVITANIRQMYRQIYVTDKHQDLQRILWREDPSQPIKIFKLRTVTYGMAASPFLAVRCLHQAAKEGEMEFPEASQIIRRDFYVDDMITGANTVEHIQRIKDEVTAVLQSVGFPLHKWVSNTSITSAEDSDGTTDFTHRIGEEMKTLGILWNHRDDNLQYNTKPPSVSGRVTKRCILSTVSQIFDPLGLVAPIIVTAKILLQELWQLKLGWDEAVPLHIHTRWLHYVKHLSYIRDIAIPRLTVIANPVRIEIHAFCDASEAAYGACVYIRSEDALNNCSSRLLCAKSRVAPLSKISLPRLELCGALLLARLHRRVVEALTINIQTHYYWCDSTITLAWIAGDPSRWKTFVGNRVAEIQELTKYGTWKYVSSEDNPADIVSRGTTSTN